MKKIAIAYYRVSTERQGTSGLGLEAQKDSVTTFAARQGYTVQKEYVEVESGKKNQRPQLLAALAQCKKEKATLIIAKLDRLGRNVTFISSLMDSKVDFLAVDNPEARPLILHILAAFAQHEREQISTRTKDALRAAKKRGQELGKHGKNVLSKQNQESARQFALKMQPVVQEIKSLGFTTVRAIMNELNSRKVPTYREKNLKWHLRTVQRLLLRLDGFVDKNFPVPA